MDAFKRLELRVQVLEERVKTNDQTLNNFSEKLEVFSHKLTSMQVKMLAGQKVAGLIGALVTPVVTSVFVLIIQHMFIH